MVEILQKAPCYFLDLVAWVNHVHSRINAVFNFDGKDSCVSVEVLSLALKTIESVCILQIKCCNTSHDNVSFS